MVIFDVDADVADAVVGLSEDMNVFDVSFS